MYNDDTNRPYKYSEQNRRIWITQDSEVAYRSINDADGNPIYIGRAKAGTLESEPKWQLREMFYDGNDSIYKILWPEDEEGNPSTFYEFVWSSSETSPITGASKASPAVITSANSFVNGDRIIIEGVVGMTQLNYDGTEAKIYTVTSASGSSFALSGVDSSAYTSYVSGGTARLLDVITYTYG